MPVKAAGSLEQQVNWRQLGYHNVEVDIEALLYDLSGDQDGFRGSPALTGLTETCQCPLLPVFSFFKRKAAVEEIHERRTILGISGYGL
jgi:hypothetical protein